MIYWHVDRKAACMGLCSNGTDMRCSAYLFHCYTNPVSMDIAALAPKAEVTVYPWKEPKDLWVKTVQQVRDFLKAHQPVAAAR